MNLYPPLSQFWGLKKNHKIDTLLGLIQDIVKHCLIKSVTVELDLP